MECSTKEIVRYLSIPIIVIIQCAKTEKKTKEGGINVFFFGARVGYVLSITDSMMEFL